jgi:hypothetical protein
MPFFILSVGRIKITLGDRALQVHRKNVIKRANAFVVACYEKYIVDKKY